MKKLLSLLLVCTLLFSLAACSAKPEELPPASDAPSASDIPGASDIKQPDSAEPAAPETPAPADPVPAPPEKEEPAEEKLPESPAEFAAYVNADNAEAHGKCGETLTWYFLNQTLVIKGTGAMADYARPNNTIYDKKTNQSVWIGNTPWADFSAEIQRIIIGEGITYAGACTFYGLRNVTSVHLPDTLVKLGREVFAECRQLESVKLPDHLEEIGELAFAYAGLKHIDLPKGLQTLGRAAFSMSALESVSIPAGISEIGEEVFLSCARLETVTFEGSQQVIGREMFRECTALQKIELRAADDIGVGAFYGCTVLEEVTFSDTLTIIRGSAFQNCTSLTSVSFPQSLSVLCQGAFYDCRYLSDVHFAEGLEIIETEAFYDCKRLSSVDLPGTLKEIGYLAFEGTSITSISIPASITTIVGFSRRMKTITFEGDAPEEIGLFRLCDTYEYRTAPYYCWALEGLPIGYSHITYTTLWYVIDTGITIHYKGSGFEDFAEKCPQYNWVKQ